MSASLYLCLHVRDFAAQALTRSAPKLNLKGDTSAAKAGSSDTPKGTAKAVPFQRTGSGNTGSHALAVLSGEPPLEFVFAINQGARALGVQLGMTRVQAESFAATVLLRDRDQEDAAFAALTRVAKKFSPRIEAIASPAPDTCGATLVLDVSGSERLLGSAQQIATAAHNHIRTCGFEASVVAAHNAYAAVLIARGMNGARAIAYGDEAATLAPLPLSVLELNSELAETFANWGIHTLGELAALPTKELIARVGEHGFQLQSLARGNYKHLLVPEEVPADAALSESVELEHPVELLEPLLFLLSRMLEQVTERANQRALAIASVETRLTLASSADDGTRTELRCTVRPALPERNHHTLLKLMQLDLELHPPEAAVLALRVTAQPARAQSVQHGLFAAQTPETGRLEVLLARLRKLVGEERVGAAELLDTHSPEAFRMNEYNVSDVVRLFGKSPKVENYAPRESAVRMLRPPHAVHTELRGNSPSTLYYEGQRFRVETSSGPWRTDGAWWTHPAWSREEWDVVLDESPQRCLRLAFDPGASCWYVIGIYD